MSRVEAQPAWVLHRRPWRESSLLLELFTRDHGRVGLVAKGARGARSAWRGLAEPFAPLEAGWSRRGELGTLTGLEPTSRPGVLQQRALWCGFYANELLLKLLARDDPAAPLFDAYGRLIAGLATERQAATLLRNFELDVLDALGVVPDFDQAADDSGPIEAGALYHLQPEQGFVMTAATGPAVFSGRAILGLAGGQELTGEIGRQARELTRLLLDHQLDGQVLKTRELFRERARSRPGSDS